MTVQACFPTLSCPDLSTSVAFYEALLQRSPVAYLPGKYAEFHLAGMRLALFVPRPDHLAEFTSTTSGPLSLCFEVNHLEEAIAHLSDLGYPPPGPVITASHGREIYAYDPDGNRLILHESC